MLKVFISSTYQDLIEHRKEVIDQLSRMNIHGVKMEYFGATDDSPALYSLRELETCSVYLGIIGHRYGSSPHEGSPSFTELEYERARELYEEGKMRLRIYVADDQVPVLPHLIENDALRARQDQFRQRLAKHAYKTFRTPHELASWVAADLYELAVSGDYRDTSEVTIFGKEDLNLIKAQFDGSTTGRFSNLQTFLNFVAQSFTSLFDLDLHRLDMHPLFKQMRDRLIAIIPAVGLNEEGGILERTGVRHVILRKETLLMLMRSVDRSRLYDLGLEIGNGAASDLIEHTVKRDKFIPASAEAFVSLWDYWDRSGGWGMLSLFSESVDIDPTEDLTLKNGSLDRSRSAQWRIDINNSFLESDDPAERHELCAFWCGYIHGFLNTALRRIDGVMSSLDEKQRSGVTLPAFHRVVTVTHQPGDSPTHDVFTVVLEKERLSDARQLLSECQRRLRDRDYLVSMVLCQNALMAAKAVLGDQLQTLAESPQLPVDSRGIIRKLLSGRPVSPDSVDENVAHRAFEATNLFMQMLSLS